MAVMRKYKLIEDFRIVEQVNIYALIDNGRYYKISNNDSQGWILHYSSSSTI